MSKGFSQTILTPSFPLEPKNLEISTSFIPWYPKIKLLHFPTHLLGTLEDKHNCMSNFLKEIPFMMERITTSSQHSTKTKSICILVT